MFGKEVSWSNGHTVIRGIIVGAKEGIGYTIVNADDPDDFLTCAKGPKSDKWIGSENPEKEAEHQRQQQKREEYLLEAAKVGKYDCDAVEHFAGTTLDWTFSPNTDSCAFNG